MSQGDCEEPAPDLIRGHRGPVAERRAPDQPLAPHRLAPHRPAAQGGHVGLRRSPLGLNQWRLQWLTLVDEQQPFEVDAALTRLPAGALARHVRSLLLTGARGFF